MYCGLLNGKKVYYRAESRITQIELVVLGWCTVLTGINNIKIKTAYKHIVRLCLLAIGHI